MSGGILIVEDEIIVAKDISETLVACGYVISGIANNSRSGMQLFKSRIPDLIICDINLGRGNSGVEFIRETRKIQEVAVVYLTAYSDEQTVRAALDTSPDAYLTKPFTSEQLCITIQRVMRNYRVRADKPSEKADPTRRELEIIKLIAAGRSSKQISEDLSISFETVQSHRKNMLNKYDVNSSAELVALALRKGWLT